MQPRNQRDGEAEESGPTSDLVVAPGDLEVFFIVLPVPTLMGDPIGRVPLSRRLYKPILTCKLIAANLKDVMLPNKQQSS